MQHLARAQLPLFAKFFEAYGATHQALSETIPPLTWTTFSKPCPYLETLAAMDSYVQALQKKEVPEAIWLLEHPSLYTTGALSKVEDFLSSPACPVYPTPRGGQITYHGPGQRIVYVMLNLKQRDQDVRRYVRRLLQWGQQTLVSLDVPTTPCAENIGLWCQTPSGRAKIMAVGVRVQKWVTSHGVAINVAPDLSYYKNIVPCGVRTAGITSLAALGKAVDLAKIDQTLLGNIQYLLPPQ